MTRLIGALDEVAGEYDALFCDLWGCVHNGVRAFPAAVSALQRFRAAGGRVVLVTNAPRPAPAVTSHFPRLGVPDDAWDTVVTSGDASREAMAEGAVGERVWHCGPDQDETFFHEGDDGIHVGHVTRVPLDQAEGIVCTGLFDDRGEVPEDYRGGWPRRRSAG